MLVLSPVPLVHDQKVVRRSRMTRVTARERHFLMAQNATCGSSMASEITRKQPFPQFPQSRAIAVPAKKSNSGVVAEPPSLCVLIRQCDLLLALEGERVLGDHVQPRAPSAAIAKSLDGKHGRTVEVGYHGALSACFLGDLPSCSLVRLLETAADRMLPLATQQTSPKPQATKWLQAEIFTVHGHHSTPC